MTSENMPIANPLLVLREEFQDWAVLFNPDTGEGFGFNPVSAFIYKHLDGKHTLDDIMQALRAECRNMPDDADTFVSTFIDDLVARGLAGYEVPMG